MKIITTLPPYAPYIEAVARHDAISGIRLNTVMPIKEPIKELLKRLKELIGKKKLWIDLKCRQIRVSYGEFFNSPKAPKKYVIDGVTHILDPDDPRTHGMLKTPPWATIKIDHKIKLDLSKCPIQCFFQNGLTSALIAEIINGDELIMLDGPQKIVGGGESINILDPSLEVEGYFTDLDLQYIETAKKAEIHTYMLSFVEQDSDIEQLLNLDPDAKVIAKIESKKGLEWLKNYSRYQSRVRLMAARGDLYIQLGRPDNIIEALSTIQRHDSTAVAASRILDSLRYSFPPNCSDITDVMCLLQMGYQTLMIGDDICFNYDLLELAIQTLCAIGRHYS